MRRTSGNASDSSSECEHVLGQAQEANEHLVVSIVRAEELAATESTARLRAERLAEYIVRWFYVSVEAEQQKQATARSVSRGKDEFFVMLGHELRDELAPIIETLELIASQGADTNEREHRSIRRRVDRLTKLVDELLDVTTTTTGPSEAPRTICRVLVIDDDQDTASLIATSLEERGHDVRFAHDGPSALAIASSFRPDVVLLDIGLPGMNGYEVAGQLRRLLGAQALHFIALTGYGQPSDRLQSHDAGFHEHLVKPVSIATIESSIATARHAPALV